jgi:hypothetical protein
MNAARDNCFFGSSSKYCWRIPGQMIDDLKEQEGVPGICGLGTWRNRAALIGFTTT